MNSKQAKKLITIASQEWNFKKKNVFLKVIDLLDESVKQEAAAANEFEFSLIENERKLRLLHLNFWKPNLTPLMIEIILKKRRLFLSFILKYLKYKFNASYNLSLFRLLDEFNQKNGCFPIQFGLEYSKDFLPKVKIYLSSNSLVFNLKKFCFFFNLDHKILTREFKHRYFDAIGIDLLPDGDFYFKFYPLRHPHGGSLYRFDRKSKKLSVKTWERFPQKLTLQKFEKLNFMKLPLFLKNIFREDNLIVSYLCIENDKKSFYFR